MRLRKPLICLLALAFVLQFAGSVSAQRRGVRRRPQASSSKASLPALTPEQKEVIANLLEYAEEAEATFTVDSGQFADKAFAVYEEKEKVEGAEISEPYASAVDQMISAYTDFGIFYGRATDTGLYNAVSKLQQSTGGQSDPALEIIREYGFEGLNKYEIINRLHRLALARKAVVSQLLAKSPTAASKAAASPQPKVTKQAVTNDAQETGTQSVSAELESLAAQSNQPRANQGKQPAAPTMREDSPLVGSWLISITNANNQTNTFTFEVEEDGSSNKCFMVDNGTREQLTDCTVSGDRFSFKLTDVPSNGQRYDTTFSGRLEGSNLIGSMVANSHSGISITLPLTGTRRVQ